MIIDEIDLEILQFLQDDAKMPAKEMASQLGLTTTPIYERIKKMEAEGLILKYQAVLDPHKLDQTLLVYMSITLKEHGKVQRNKFIASILKLEQILEFSHTSGSFDFFIKARFTDIDTYRDFLVNRISTIENINDIESHIVLEELKPNSTIKLSHNARS